MRFSKKIYNKLCCILSGCFAISPIGAHAATFSQANAHNIELYHSQDDVRKSMTETVFSYVPDEIVLYHASLGKRLYFVNKIRPYQFLSNTVDSDSVLGAYSLLYDDIELLIDSSMPMYLNLILAPAHEYAHFLYYETRLYWTPEMFDQLYELHELMKELCPAECYHEAETFAVAYAHLKFRQAALDNGWTFGWSIPGTGDNSELLVQYEDLFRSAEQLMIDMYNGDMPERTIKGPGDFPSFIDAASS